MRVSRFTPDDREEALRDATYQRLKACHGETRAVAIMEGRDPETNADLARWRRLGERKRGVA